MSKVAAAAAATKSRTATRSTPTSSPTASPTEAGLNENGRDPCSMKPRAFLVFLALLVAVSVWVGCRKQSAEPAAASPSPRSLTVFYSCDTRGHIDPCGCSTGMAGGIARRKTFLDSRPRGPHLLVDAGDVTAGARAWEILELEYLLKGYEQMGYHAVNAGHREASLGKEGLRKLSARFGNLVSANLVDETGNLLLAPYRVVSLADGSKAGILGILDDRIAPSELGRGLRILPPQDAIARFLPELKKQAGFILVLAFADEERMKEIAERFFELNLIVGGKVLRSEEHTS